MLTYVSVVDAEKSQKVDLGTTLTTSKGKFTSTAGVYSGCTATMSVAGTWYIGSSYTGGAPTVTHANANQSVSLQQSAVPHLFIED